MKVLEVLGGEYAGGGQETFVFNLTESLLREGMDVECLIPYTMPEDIFTSINTRLSQRLFSLGIGFDPRKNVNEIYRPFIAFLKEHRYDVVHIHSSRITMMSMMAVVAKRAGVSKVIVHSHNTEANDTFKHRVLRFLGGMVMSRNVDVYCACSRAAAEWKFNKKYADRAIIIKNGIDVDRFRFNPVKRREWRKNLGIADDTFVIGNVGRLSEQKNQIFLVGIIEAMKHENCALLLVGDGEERERIERLVDEKKLKDKCLLVGSVNNVQDYLQAMDVFVMPSIYEGFPLTLVEAQAAGLPVVISNKITKEVVISPDVIAKSIEQPTDEWAEAIKSYWDYQRQDRAQTVIDAGYDHANTVREIIRMYSTV